MAHLQESPCCEAIVETATLSSDGGELVSQLRNHRDYWQ
uniref:Uncharacterized protein n=1 Tax=Arundo donax TaxID=35708 RepID=A0A0A9C2X0_ARUDO